MNNSPLAPVDKAQAAINCDSPPMTDRIVLPPVDQLRRAIEVALTAFEPDFLLTRDPPEAQAPIDHLDFLHLSVPQP